jgi:hypothetical protein
MDDTSRSGTLSIDSSRWSATRYALWFATVEFAL